MPYIDSNARTTKPTSNERFEPIGRISLLNGVYVGFIKDAADVQKNGRLRVWIPELGSAPEDEKGWVVVNYCSPFAGATDNETTNKGNIESFDGTQTSYGMWMIPPDINNQVIVMFVSGDPAKGIWIGCLYNQFMNNMVPAMASSTDNYQYPGKKIPVAEYNKWDLSVTNPDSTKKPYQATKFKGVGNQGLITDTTRGITTTSARRESPSDVFGIITPGPVIDNSPAGAGVRRKGGSSFIMDDGKSTEYVQLSTKSGAQVRIDETNGFIYLINRDGTAWVQMDQAGNVDIFGARDISMRAQRDINLRADRNINIESGQNIFMKAAKDTKEEKVSFTYDVNNSAKTKNTAVWQYKGEGAGDGGNIVMQALNNWQSTTKNNVFLTVIDSNMHINVGNTLNATTQNGAQNYNSKQGIKMSTDAAFDLTATGNIRVGAQGSISAVGVDGITLCSSADVNIKAVGNILAAAAGNTLLTSSTFGVNAVTSISGGFTAGGPVALGGEVEVPEANPANAESAISAGTARLAEVKPLNEKLNILATWKDPESKFKRNSQSIQTTVSRFPTFEPCPEHENFKLGNVSGFAPVITPDDKTYGGSAGAGNSASTAPAATVNPGANNTSVAGDPVDASSVSKDINIDALRCQLKLHEGVKNVSYKDTENLLTAGIGHLLRDNEIVMYPLGSPVSDSQVETWFSQDSSTAIKIAQELLGGTWADLTDIRKRAIVDLAYNLGKNGLSKFRLFLAAIKDANYKVAGEELRKSVWFNQVGRRGPNVITMIVQDIDPTGCVTKSAG